MRRAAFGGMIVALWWLLYWCTRLVLWDIERRITLIEKSIAALLAAKALHP